mgnify:CR=1 FL=1
MLQTHVQKILIIKLGALGDFIQAFSFIAAIRKAHPKAHIRLLTTKPFEKFAQDSKYCDDIWIDEKPKFFNFVKCRAFQKKLNAAGFDRVYDLQNNDRTALYFKLINPKPEWVGTGRGISHRNIVDRSQVRHEFDVHIQTLAGAGIKNIKIDELNWMTGDISSFKINTPYIS